MVGDPNQPSTARYAVPARTAPTRGGSRVIMARESRSNRARTAAASVTGSGRSTWAIAPGSRTARGTLPASR